MPRLHVKDEAKAMYIQSDDVADLEEIYARLRDFVETPIIKKNAAKLADRNIEFMISESMMIQLGAKIQVLKYCRGFTETDYVQLKNYISEYIELAEHPSVPKITETVSESGETVITKTEKSYDKALRLLANLRDYSDSLHEIVKDAARDMDSITYDGDRATHDPERAAKVLERFSDRLVAIEDVPFAVFPPEVNIPDVTAIARDALVSTMEKISGIFSATKMEQMRELIDEFVTPFDEVEGIRHVEYYDTRLTKVQNLASTVIIATPFEDEAILLARMCGKEWGREFSKLNLTSLSAKTPEEIKLFFEVLSLGRYNLLVTGFAECREAVFPALAEGVMSLASGGARCFVVDKIGDHKLYEAFESLAESTPGLSSLNVSHEFLKMPHCAGTLSMLVDRGIITNTEKDYSRVKEKLPFMGYVGLNMLLNGESFGVVETHSNNNLGMGLAYLGRLVSQSHLIDPDWGDFSKNVRFVGGERVVFDYDSFRPLDKKNIKSIVEKPGLSLFAKCGIAVKYCILAGDDLTAWARLDDEEKTERVNLATSVVCMLLNTAYTPKVEVFSNDEWNEKAKTDDSYKGSVGLCINKGKVMHFKSEYLNTPDNCITVICHECFHAFQHTAVDGSHTQWYFIELGVTAGRVDAWGKNFNKYIKSGDGYFVEIVEADAEAFAYDCLRGERAHWQEIDFSYYDDSDDI